MRRAALPLLIAAGCGRIGFDARGDGGGGGGGGNGDGPSGMLLDATPVAAACNTPVRLAAASLGSLQEVSVAQTATGFVASWVTAATTAAALAVALPAPATAQPIRQYDDVTGAGGGIDEVAIAANGAIVTVYTRTVSIDKRTLMFAFDSELAAQMGSGALVEEIESPRAVTARPAASDFALVSPEGGGFPVVLEEKPGQSDTVGPQAASMYAQPSLEPLASTVALVGATTSATCEVQLFDLGAGTFGAQQAWGPVGGCAQAWAAADPATGNMLMLRWSSSEIRLSVASTFGNTAVVGSELATMFFGDQPRLATDGSSYWLVRLLGSDVFADRFDTTGTQIGTDSVLGAPAAPLAEEVFVHAGTPYAFWLDGASAWLARLCIP